MQEPSMKACFQKKKKTNVEKKQRNAVLKKTRTLLIRAAKVPLRLISEVSEAFWETVQREKGEKSLRERLEPAAFFLAILAGSAIISLAAFPLQVYPAGFALLSSVGGGTLRKKEEKINHLIFPFHYNNGNQCNHNNHYQYQYRISSL